MSILPRNKVGQQLTLPTGQSEVAELEKKVGLLGRFKTGRETSRAAVNALIDVERLRVEGQRDIVKMAIVVGVQQAKLAIANAAVDSSGALLVGLNCAMAAADQALWNGAQAETFSHLINRQECLGAAQRLRESGVVNDGELAELVALAKLDAAENLGRSRERATKSSQVLEGLYNTAVDCYYKTRDEIGGKL